MEVGGSGGIDVRTERGSGWCGVMDVRTERGSAGADSDPGGAEGGVLWWRVA